VFIWIAAALAGNPSLESSTLDTRAEALDMRALAEAEGLDARIVRRYVSGSGWEYTVIVDDLDPDAAEVAASAWAEAAGEGITIFRRDGDDTPAVELPAPTPAAEPHAAAGADLLEAQVVLQHAVRALGGREGGRASLDRAPALRFEYVREVRSDDVLISAHHELLRSADGQRLRITGQEHAVDSTTLVHPEGAWVQVDGTATERDRDRAAEVVNDFGPEQLLAYPLDFVALVESEPGYRLLRTTSDAGGVYVLEYGGPEVGGAMRLEIEGQAWHPVAVRHASEAGEVRYVFADWREIDTGLVLPFEVELHRDGVLVDRLTVADIAVLKELEDGALALP